METHIASVPRVDTTSPQTIAILPPDGSTSDKLTSTGHTQEDSRSRPKRTIQVRGAKTLRHDTYIATV